MDFWRAGPLLRSLRLYMGRRTAMLLRGRLGSTSIDRTSDSFTQRTGKHLSQTKASFHEFLLNKWKFFWPVMIYPIESVSQVFQITDGALTCRTCSLIQSFVSALNLNLINFRQGLTFSLASNHLADRTDSEIRTLRSLHRNIILSLTCLDHFTVFCISKKGGFPMTLPLLFQRPSPRPTWDEQRWAGTRVHTSWSGCRTRHSWLEVLTFSL